MIFDKSGAIFNCDIVRDSEKVGTFIRNFNADYSMENKQIQAKNEIENKGR